MRNILIIIYIITILFFANEGLNFGSWWHVEGVFNIADVGNALVWLGLIYILSFGGKQKRPKSALDWLIPFYLFFVCVQIAIGSLYYNQPLYYSVAGARHQFYFASYFLFFALLDSPVMIRSILRAITILALLAVVLGILNYVEIIILHHKWAEGHGIRSGIERAYIPGMAIISFAFVWSFSRWADAPVKNKISGVVAVVLLAAHFFRQSRMRVLGVLLTATGLLIFRKRFKTLLACFFLGLLSLVAVGIVMEENLVLSVFTSIQEDIEKGGGSWAGRISQMETAWKEFIDHPYIGSGSSTLRIDAQQSSTVSREELAALAAKADLGYMSWAKAYGILGIIWLFLFFGILFFRAKKAIKINAGSNGDISSFGMAFLMFIMTTFLTLNHMMQPNSIPLVCMTAAIIVRMSTWADYRNKIANNSVVT